MWRVSRYGLLPAILLLSVKGVAMTFYSGARQDIVLFSPMRGVLTYQGSPAVGAKITRHIIWQHDYSQNDIVYSGQNGSFYLGLLQTTISLPPFTQLVVSQQLEVEHAGRHFVIWSLGKLDKELYGELGGKPVQLRCELTDPLVRVEVPSGGLGTSCKWTRII